MSRSTTRARKHVPPRYQEMQKLLRGLGVNVSTDILHRTDTGRRNYFYGAEGILTALLSLPQERTAEIARTEFNLLAPHYNDTFRDHSEAAVDLLSSAMPLIVHSIQAHLNKRSQGGNGGRALRFFDPAAGTGAVAIPFLLRLKEAFPDVPFFVAFNDIAENMESIANARMEAEMEIYRRSKSVGLVEQFVSSNKDFIGTDNPRALVKFPGKKAEPVDVILVSQLFDILKGWKAKRDALERFCKLLDAGALLVLVGEETPQFRACKKLGLLEELLFRALFDAFRKEDAVQEVERIADGTLKIVPGGVLTYPINKDPSHRLYVILAERQKENSLSFTLSGVALSLAL